MVSQFSTGVEMTKTKPNLKQLLKEDRKLQRKLDKEMPPPKFKKGDPFALGKGGWAVPHEELKELLDED